MVRILIPVLSVPITGKIKEAFAKRSKQKEAKAQQPEPKLDKKA